MVSTAVGKVDQKDVTCCILPMMERLLYFGTNTKKAMGETLPGQYVEERMHKLFGFTVMYVEWLTTYLIDTKNLDI